jgi:endonuclease YncB( thermonuclease family)
VLEERTKAQSAKKYVQDFVALGNITMESFKSDKYGRYLGKLYSGSRCLNDELLSQNLAAPYFGEGVKSY